ncbi:hypothetical protein [Microlunatus speluncae]|uniref:hypothetical protein n=1 Tax=Microlunatus speluncae TaxID=2594267 RepID=UPI0012661B0B|nr:hypothetical protein [Microlunatus speluncae]
MIENACRTHSRTSTATRRLARMTSPADIERKVRQLDNDVHSIYEFLTTISETQGRHGNRLDEIDQKIEGVDQKVTGLEQRFDGLEQRFDGLEHRFDGLEQKVAGHDRRFDGVDQRFDGVDRKLDQIIGLLDVGNKAVD